MIYSKDAYITESTDTFDPEYYSYCPDAEAFNKTLVRGKILICNFLQLFSGGAGIEIDDAIVTAKKLGAVGLIIVSPEIAESSQINNFGSSSILSTHHFYHRYRCILGE